MVLNAAVMVNYIYHRYKKEKKYWGIKKMFYLCRAKVGGNSSVVEHHLAKVRVAGPNPVFRSTISGAVLR